MDILNVAKGRTKPMTLDERIKKAIANIDGYLGSSPKGELKKSLDMTGEEFLLAQKLLLTNLLKSVSW